MCNKSISGYSDLTTQMCTEVLVDTLVFTNTVAAALLKASHTKTVHYLFNAHLNVL